MPVPVALGKLRALPVGLGFLLFLLWIPVLSMGKNSLMLGLTSSNSSTPTSSFTTTNTSSLNTTSPPALKTQRPTPVLSPSKPDRPLILFAYFETDSARRNLEFFLAHALHGAADFIFIFNGETNAEELVPELPNVSFVKRENHCYDLGAFAEVLLEGELYKRYQRFITINASIRGPFLPAWADGACWSDVYLNGLTDEIKLVGMSMNCDFQNHIQSMLWATDRIGMEILLVPNNTHTNALKKELSKRPCPGCWVPPMERPGISACPNTYWEAVALEIYATPLIRAMGYKVTAMMNAYWARAPYGTNHELSKVHVEYEPGSDSDGPDFERFYALDCKDTHDMMHPDAYYGLTMHPFETMFVKTKRNIDPLMIETLTKWADGRGYSSYDYCR